MNKFELSCAGLSSLSSSSFGREGAKITALLICIFLFTTNAPAQIQTPASPVPISVVSGTPYTQDFNALATTGTSGALPQGWAFCEAGSAEDSTYAAGSGSSVTGNTYSFGLTGNSDRAFGGLQSGSLISTVGAVFKNDSGTTITSLTISYTGEEWRLGDGSGRLDRIDFQISTDATNLFTGTWIDFDDLDFTTPNTTTTGAKDGNAVENRNTLTVTITGISVSSGSVLWIRWVDLNATGSDDGLSVDDFSLEIAGTTAVKLAGFNAFYDKTGVLLKWQTSFEVNNLGFNIYREDPAERIRLNPSIIAGSALMTAPGAPMTAGNSYSWVDPGGTSDSTYYLEDVDVDGTRTTHEPVVPTTAGAQSGPLTHSYATLLDNLTSGLRNNVPRQYSASRQLSTNSLTGSAVAKVASLSASRLSAVDSINSSARETQRILAAMPGLKLSVREDGWYRVMQAAIVGAGFDANSDLRYLQLYEDGIEIPIRINSTRNSGPLRAGDSIEFYGASLQTLSTDTRDYWLVSGNVPGKRIKTQSSKNINAGQVWSESFEQTVELRERLLYFSGLLNGDTSNFFGQVINSRPVDQKLSIRHLHSRTTSGSRLEVALQGVTWQDHAVSVMVNGLEVGSVSFSGLAHIVGEFSLRPGVLREGENTVTFQRLNGEMDISLVDYVRLSYPHTFQADDDYLQFVLAGSARVSGFSNPRVYLLDITEPHNVHVHSQKTEKTVDGYSITLQTDQTRTFVALSDQRVRQVAAISFNRPSNWNANVKGADFLIITHRDFIGSVEPLAHLRQREGMTVAVLDVQDIFDEFSYGAPGPRAIRDFLSWTQTHWERAPQFVLLVGDGSFDPRNHLGNNGDPDVVPSPLVDTALLETASDDWFVDFDNDGIGEMSLGRLPARTASEAETMISRIVNYVSENTVQKVLMVTDRSDINATFTFEAASDELAALLPSSFGIQRIYRGNRAASDLRDEIISGINQGVQVVNFMGHGSVEVWTGESIFSTSDTSRLTNGDRLPLVLMMTCLNGLYQNPVRGSLAESLVRSEMGGAIAVWTSSGMTPPSPQLDMSRVLFNDLFGSESLRLGEAIRNAKRGTRDLDVRRTWMLFGDPTMRIR
ncbi:MAG TPA: C25 family cysteine peptidase [Pyrinomonadaceae bacterium]|nr:C25 family cysteine peptidase [Pyrinomonadaceae bacterium]